MRERRSFPFCLQTYIKYLWEDTQETHSPLCPLVQECVVFTVYSLGSFEFGTMSMYYLRKQIHKI